MKRPRKVAKRPKTVLDSVGEKRGRGRPPNIPASWIVGRASNYRMMLDGVWDRLWPLLSKVQNEEDVARAFQQSGNPYDREFVPLAGFVLPVLRETRFPKRRAARIGFLADSLAGAGSVTPRRSRDVCAEWRARDKEAQKAYHIIRYEFLVECSCGYKGRSQNHACVKCGARINFGSAISTLTPWLAGIDQLHGS
jgi:hypothetical protein